MILFFVMLMLSNFTLAAAGSDTELTDLKVLDFSIRIDKSTLPEGRCILRKNVAESLVQVQNTLKIQGFLLKVLDCYRPNTERNHGTTVNVTLLERGGADMVMPVTEATKDRPLSRDEKRSAKRHVAVLVKAMQDHKFHKVPSDWQRFEYVDALPAEDTPIGAIPDKLSPR